jgi:M6 family metalloprotease-like protein
VSLRNSLWAFAWICAGTLCPGAGAYAQDMEVAADIHGVTLPQEYYDRIAQNPNVFELPQVWLGQRPQAVDGGNMPVSGHFKLLVIPALFADSEEPIFPVEDVRRVLFEGPSEAGTLTDFYLEASGGLLTVEGVVAPWVRTSLTVAEVVGESAGLGDNTGTGDYLVEAVELADEVIDFTQFDNDGPDGVPNSGDDDGVVDVINFEFQEVSASCGGPAIWPHRSAMVFWLGDALATDDVGFNGNPMLIFGYTITSAADCSGETLQTAGVVSHEFGHVLGLPDLYHPIDGLQPQNRRWVLGCWGLMAAGSWGCGDGSTRGLSFGPTHLSPWSKDQLGWIQWVDVGDVFNEELVLGPTLQTREALRVALDDDGVEYLVLEYRSQSGTFDSNLPSSGVLIYHWDKEGVRRPDRDIEVPYLFGMIEADGRRDLLLTATNGGNRGEASDAWGQPGAPQAFLNNETTPGTSRHAEDSPSRLTIHSIVVAGDEARVRLTNSFAPGVVDVSGLPEGHHFNPFMGSLTIAGGLMPYTAFVGTTLPAHGMTVDTDGMRLLVGGAPDVMGDFEISVTIKDAQGQIGTVVVPITVGDFVMTLDRALTAFIHSEAVQVNEGEQSILDAQGNGNGFYDIGDLRSFVLRGS